MAKIRKGTLRKAINPETGRVVSVPYAKKLAWQSLSRLVRKLEPICVTCNQSPSSDAGHWKHNTDKENKNLGGNELWFDVRNIHGQCNQCNRHHSSKPVEYALYMEERYGHGIIQELYKLYRTPKKWTIEEILDIKRKYDEEYTKLST